jgi:phage/plasmid-like protein (TIGR03299 family)
MVNSHDGSRAFSLSLTTVRVVCRNTIKLALDEKKVPKFRRAHRGTPKLHKQQADAFWAKVLGELDGLEEGFQQLAQQPCADAQFQQVLDQIFPLPHPPKATSPRQRRAFEKRRQKMEETRAIVSSLRDAGKGAELATAKGTLWGALNAVTEYIDHHHECQGSRLAYSLLGSGSEIKAKAYRVVHEMLSQSV